MSFAFTPIPARLRRRTPLAVAAAALLLAACGGGGDDDAAAPPPSGATGTVSVTPSLGAVYNADVSVTCASSGVLLGSGSTGATGLVNVATSGECAGPVRVNVSGRADGSSTYYDEALASVLAFPAGSTLRALAPAAAATMNLAVTPLTEMAAAQALGAAGSLAALTAAQVNAANAAVVSQVLGAGVTLDILVPPTQWTAATAAGSLGATDADRYALYLAGLARLGLGDAAPARAATTALAADLADGQLDGSAAGSVNYSTADLGAQLAGALDALAAYASPALQAALGLTVAPPLAVSGFSPGSGAAGDTVTLTGTGFDADPFHMQVSFADNLPAEVVSSSATQVVVRVPAGAVSGPVVVRHTLSGASTTSSASFSVTAVPPPPVDQWTSRASPSGFLLNGLAYGAGRFVAVGFAQTLLTSSNGLSWTAGTAIDTQYYELKSVIWTGTQFVMVGDKSFNSSAAPLIATSPDGLAWTRRSWTPGTEYETLVDVAAGGTRITAVGINGTVVASTDGGATWATESGPIGAYHGVADSGSVRVAVGRDGSYTGQVAVHAGSGWTLASLGGSFYPRRVTWTGSRFVAVGSSQVSAGSAMAATSTDGASWTLVNIPDTVVPGGFNLGAVAAVGGVLYATGDNLSNRHVIIKSTDGGASWTQAYTGQVSGNAMLAGIAGSADRVVTVGGVKSVTLP